MHVGMKLETEGHDRSDINLPGDQLQLLQDATDSATSESSIIRVYFIELTQSDFNMYGSAIMYFELY